MGMRFRDALLGAFLPLGILPMGAASAKALVLHASGPSAAKYPPGLLLAEPLEVRLKAGDRLRVLDAKGTRELRGPLTLKGRDPTGQTRRTRPSWQDLMGPKLRTDAAGVRDISSSARTPEQPLAGNFSAPQLWQIDPLTGGTWCVPDIRAIEFWRHDPSGEIAMTVSSSDTSVQYVWPEGRTVLAWPAMVPATDMTKYTVRQGRKPAVDITLRRINVGTDLGGLARALSLNGCHQQRGLLSQ